MSIISSFISAFIRELDREFPDENIDIDFWNEIYSSHPPKDTLETIINEVNDNVCIICFESYKIKEKINILQCKHTFHITCITKWLNKCETCPICRRKI
jgi:hypothetical protein